MLGLALCAVALSVAYPVRNYLSQRAQESVVVAQQHELEQQIADLQARKAALGDPAYIKAEAKRRLQYVSPGDTVYVVKAPPLPTGSAGAATTTGAGATGTTGAAAAQASAAAPDPWYAALWDTLQNGAPAGGK